MNGILDNTPWTIEIQDGMISGTDYKYSPQAFIKDSEGNYIASKHLTSVGYSGTEQDRKSDESVVKFLATAPELLEALEEIVNVAIECDPRIIDLVGRDRFQVARAAIAKAKGETVDA